MSPPGINVEVDVKLIIETSPRFGISKETSSAFEIVLVWFKVTTGPKVTEG